MLRRFFKTCCRGSIRQIQMLSRADTERRWSIRQDAGRTLLVVTLGLLLLLDVSCSREAEQKTSAQAKPSTTSTNPTVYQVKGVVVELEPEEKTVRIKHEEIPGYMRAMTMSFDVRDTNELAGLEAGDHVAFRMLVTDTDGWIDQLRKLPRPTTNNPPTTGPFRFVRDVEPLGVGDVLPEYRFTNQLGQAVSTSQFRGRALAITFIFTRCPFPTFCPRTMENFAETQRKLLALASGPTNWHLLTISFDPAFDTPAVLKAYGQTHSADPRRWTLATGALIDITAIAEQFGLTFWSEDGGISHNLRTAVIDPAGRVRKVLIGNKWTSEELVAEMTRVASEGAVR
jgi:protein SCO1/2